MLCPSSDYVLPHSGDGGQGEERDAEAPAGGAVDGHTNDFDIKDLSPLMDQNQTLSLKLLTS